MNLQAELQRDPFATTRNRRNPSFLFFFEMVSLARLVKHLISFFLTSRASE